MRSAIVWGVLALAAGAGGAYWWFSSSAERAVTARVLSALSDPGSAEFEAVIYNPKHDVGCGLVNARNRLGGMVGRTPFMAFKDGEVRLAPALGEPGREAWMAQALVYCSPDDEAVAMRFWDAMDSLTGLPAQ